MKKSPVTFIGGPLDGKVLMVDEGLNYYEAVPLTPAPATPMSDANAKPERESFTKVIYKRGQRALDDMGKRFEQVFVMVE